MSIVNSGFFYNKFIDPALSSIHDAAVRLAPANSKVIDVACGTGALSLKLAENSEKVIGIDISKEMIATAKKAKQKQGFTNVEFQVLDATDLSCFKNDEFDLVTISMAIHQFHPETAKLVIHEINRVAEKILFIDYTSPLPKNLYRPFIITIERFAGKEHAANFKAFQKLGGIPTYLNEFGLNTNRQVSAGNSNFTIILCSKQ